MHQGKRRQAASIIATALAALPAVSSAAVFTWNGGDPSFGIFSQADNWVGNAAPPSNATADIVFASTNLHGNSPTLNYALDVHSFSFNTSALAWTISTNASGFSGVLTLESGGLTDNASNAEILSGSTSVVLNASQPWNVAGGVFTDSTPLNLSSSVLTVNTTVAGGSATLSGILSGTGRIVKTGAGTLFLTGSGSSIGGLSEQGGAVQVSSGTLSLASSTAFGISSGTVTVVNSGTIVDASSSSQPVELIDGPAGTGLTVRIGAQFKGGSALNVGATGQAFLNVSQGATASVINSLVVGSTGGSSLSISIGGSVTSPTGDVGITPGTTGTVTVDGIGSQWNFTNLNIGGLNTAGGNGTVTVTNNASVVGTGTIGFNDNSAVLNISNGARVTAGGINSLSAGNGAIMLTDPPGGTALTITNPAPSFNYYTGSISGTGSVLVSGGLTQYLVGANTFTGQVTLQGGYLELGSGTSAGYFAQSGTLQLDFGNLGSSVVYSYAGSTVVYNSTTLTGGTLIGDGTHNISAVSNFYGTTIDNGVSLTPRNSAFAFGVNSAGNITVPAGNQFYWFGGSNSGNLNVSGTTVVTSFNSAGILQINNGGSVNVQSSNLVLQGGSRTYVGSSAAPGGLLLLHSGITVELNGGLLVNSGNVSGGTVDVNYGGLATGAGSYGTVVVNAGGTYLPGNFTPSSPVPPVGSPNALIQPAGLGATSTGTSISANANVTITVTGTDSLTLASPLITNGNSVTKTGTGTVILSPFATSSLNVSSGVMKLSGTGGILQAAALSVSTGATFDLASQPADVSGTSLATINSLVQQGYSGGKWNGSGIVSSSAAADLKQLTAIGVIQNNQGGTAIYTDAHRFEGITPAAGDVLLKYTYYGDANLDGKIDGSDYSRIDAGYLSHGTVTGWFNGDFNYDGVVDGSDYTLIDNGFNTQGAALAFQVASTTTQIGRQPVAVPEPTGTLPLIPVLTFLARRRTKC